MKKTGTDQYLPQIKAGFIENMAKDYNLSKEKSEKLIVSFLKVIEDASSYLFSENHAIPYSMIGFEIGYLRYYYPIETITAALNVYNGDINKVVEITKYANRKGITIKDIRFGKSHGNYFPDKENNAIYKGIASIKYCSTQIADELLEVSKKGYDNFVDLVFDIKKNTTLDSRQMKILILLNFFNDFGKNKRLQKIFDIVNQYIKRKEFKKKDLDQGNCPFSEYMVKKYSDKETPAKYTQIDMQGLIREWAASVNDESFSAVYHIKNQYEFLGYATYKNPSINKVYWYVVDVTYDNYNRMWITLYNIRNGIEREMLMDSKSKNLLTSEPILKEKVIAIRYAKEEFIKRKSPEGKFVLTGATRWRLFDWILIKEDE